MNTKSIMLGAFAICGGVMAASACTGISLKAKDGSYVQARTIENANEPLPSEYVIIPRGQEIVSFTPVAANGLKFKAKYGVVGMSVVRREFIAEGINEAGLSAGLFFFPTYGSYMSYDATDAAHTLGDLQVPTWILANFATIDELKEGIKNVRNVGLDKTGVVHWRIGEKSGRQVVLEIVNGKPHFCENTVGVLTNAPGF
jgi:choloylglycine hydrolase